MVVATWLLVANLTRYASLASITAISLAPFYALLLIGRLDVLPPLFIIALFVLFKHGKNISRLFDGTEPKIHLKKTLLKEVIDDEKKTKNKAQEELEPEDKKN
jgi:glycerol-3-phosphate acyltransferase PlsY